MDSLIAASARALVAGDALGALKLVALRDDPPALALRGIAMAQLGDHARARDLLRRAARGFGAHEELARARCVVAEAEVALAVRDLGSSPRTLAAALATLEVHADHANALLARLIAARRLLLLGRLDDAEAALAGLDARGLPPSLAAVAELTAAELALRSLRIEPARAALARAHAAADRARVPALLAEVAEARAALDRPAARRLFPGGEQALRLDEVAALLTSDALVVDACRRGLGVRTEWRPLARRPVLFALARALAAAWPGDVDREALIACGFGAHRPNESHRARLRVEIGRLRALVTTLAHIEATAPALAVRRDPSTGRVSPRRPRARPMRRARARSAPGLAAPAPDRAGPGKMKTTYFWPIYGERDEICFTHSPGRSGQHVRDVLGLAPPDDAVLLSDGYAAYASYAKQVGLTHAQCWAHARREVFEAKDIEPAHAEKALEHIAALYAAEEHIRNNDLKGGAKRAWRQTHAKPVAERFLKWVDKYFEAQGFLPSSPFTKALNYIRERRDGLTVYLDDPDVPIDTNHLERALRVIPLGRKNWMFSWTEVGAKHIGIVQSLLVTCRLHNVDPYDYLVDVLQRVGQHPASLVEQLTPRVWKTLFANNPLRSDLYQRDERQSRQ